MLLDGKVHSAMKNAHTAERYSDILRLEVLPAMDARAESDFQQSAFTHDETVDVDILREGIRFGYIKADGIYSVGDERVGTFFYSILHSETGEKTLLIVGIGAEWADGERPVHARLMSAVIKLAKKEDCRWIKAGSTRSGVIRMLLDSGMTPVRVDFCMEVK